MNNGHWSLEALAERLAPWHRVANVHSALWPASLQAESACCCRNSRPALDSHVGLACWHSIMHTRLTALLRWCLEVPLALIAIESNSVFFECTLPLRNIICAHIWNWEDDRHTCPRAWTPASVLPEPCMRISLLFSPLTLPTAVSMACWMVGAALLPFWICQPLYAVPL